MTKPLKKGLLLRKEFAPMGANFFLYELTLIYMGGNDENKRVASPEKKTHSSLGVWVHPDVCLPFLQRETTFMTFCLLHITYKHLQN